MANKTHFRKVFKSDHLGVADLEDMIEEKKRLVFTIAYVQQEYGAKVAGKKGDFNIAYFKEGIKPLVLNSTNAKRVKEFSGGSPFVEDWAGIPIELYIDRNVKMMGDIVGGVRISKNMPPLQKPVLNPSSSNWKKAQETVKKNGSTIESVRVHYDITDKDYQLLCG